MPIVKPGLEFKPYDRELLADKCDLKIEISSENGAGHSVKVLKGGKPLGGVSKIEFEPIVPGGLVTATLTFATTKFVIEPDIVRYQNIEIGGEYLQKVTKKMFDYFDTLSEEDKKKCLEHTKAWFRAFHYSD